MNTRTYLEFALETIKKTRAHIQGKCRTGFSVSVKDDHSLVTEVDRETEQLMRHEIEKRFPDHGIVGEEFGVKNEGAEFIWYLDPIDGTISFSHGIPLYGTIMALHQRGVPLVGAIDHPGIDLCCYASKGNGIFCNGAQVVIHDLASLDDLGKEIIATGDRKQFERSGTMEEYAMLLAKHNLVRTVPDCFGHTLAAKGAVGVMIDFHISVWDGAATKLLIEEAGGKFLALKESHFPAGKIRYNIIFGKPKVVDWLAEIF
ncbi:histidinol phosphate phosphatase [Candidatus Uhrbacteria bacterium]|nr:histidinol phosphate phosphatase [Candidatus Uhrbacteria bacterium]